MARIVAGFGTSHSPMLSIPPDAWAAYAERDRHLELYDRDGEVRRFDELRPPPQVAAALDSAVFAARHAACQRHIARLAAGFAALAPDVAIVIGDDQKELYREEIIPALAIYWGETIRNESVEQVFRRLPRMPAARRLGQPGYSEPAAPRDYPVAAALGCFLVEHLMQAGFDVAASTAVPEDRGEGHAFGFVHRRIMAAHVAPVVPVLVNTYYPPNQLPPARCHALGRAIRAAVERWPGAARVAVIASGGLSHFVIDEELDQAVIAALRHRDGAALAALPPRRLNSGNSEIRNWIAAAGALDHLDLAAIDYVPCYRTSAGTGTAMAFAIWR